MQGTGKVRAAICRPPALRAIVDEPGARQYALACLIKAELYERRMKARKGGRDNQPLVGNYKKSFYI